MLNVVIAMAVAIVILVLMWRRSAGLHAGAVSDYAALQDAAKASIDSANETRGVLEEQEREIASLQRAHTEVHKNIREMSKTIQDAATSPENIAALWNQVMEK